MGVKRFCPAISPWPCCHAHVLTHPRAPTSHPAVAFEFEIGLEGWANSTSEVSVGCGVVAGVWWACDRSVSFGAWQPHPLTLPPPPSPATLTPQEMQAEVYPLGGEMAWEIRESAPHADSPLMITPTTDQNYVVTRMKYSGSSASTVGSFYFRAGNTLPPAQYAKVCLMCVSNVYVLGVCCVFVACVVCVGRGGGRGVCGEGGGGGGGGRLLRVCSVR